MKVTATTMVSVDGVMQGLGAQNEDRRGGFERGGWAAPVFDEETGDALGQIYGRADVFLFGRWTYEVFAGSRGAIEEIPQDNLVTIALNTRPKYVVSSTLKDPKWAAQSCGLNITVFKRLWRTLVMPLHYTPPPSVQSSCTVTDALSSLWIGPGHAVPVRGAKSASATNAQNASVSPDTADSTSRECYAQPP
jgi:hypothetical protein